MCLEDVTISRQLRSRVYQTTGTFPIPANPSRVAICIAADPNERAVLYAIGPAQQGITPNPNVVLGVSDASTLPQQGPSVFRLEDYGDILLGPLAIQAGAATASAYAYETYLEIATPYSPDLTKLPK